MHQFIGSDSEKKKRKSKTQEVVKISRTQELELYKRIHYKPRPLIKKEVEQGKPVVVSKYSEDEDEEYTNTVPTKTTSQIPAVSRPKVKDTLTDSGIQ